MLACDGRLVRQVMDADSVVLDQGRAVRLFTRAQRRALITRDRGCAFPGCDIPAGWCEAHHLTYWSRGGDSDLDNGILLCRHHHTVIRQEHWRVQPSDEPRDRPGSSRQRASTRSSNPAATSTSTCPRSSATSAPDTRPTRRMLSGGGELLAGRRESARRWPRSVRWMAGSWSIALPAWRRPSDRSDGAPGALTHAENRV